MWYTSALVPTFSLGLGAERTPLAQLGHFRAWWRLAHFARPLLPASFRPRATAAGHAQQPAKAKCGPKLRVHLWSAHFQCWMVLTSRPDQTAACVAFTTHPRVAPFADWSEPAGVGGVRRRARQ